MVIYFARILPKKPATLSWGSHSLWNEYISEQFAIPCDAAWDFNLNENASQNEISHNLFGEITIGDQRWISIVGTVRKQYVDVIRMDLILWRIFNLIEVSFHGLCVVFRSWWAGLWPGGGTRAAGRQARLLKFPFRARMDPYCMPPPSISLRVSRISSLWKHSTHFELIKMGMPLSIMLAQSRAQTEKRKPSTERHRAYWAHSQSS